MSDLFDDNGQMLIAPGDVADKLSILSIKIIKIKDKQDFIQEELARTSLLMDRMLCHEGIGEEFHPLLAQLTAINLDQWNLEDRVRTEESWEAAKAARDNNTLRVQKKNEINKLFGYPVEIKEYKGSRANQSLKDYFQKAEEKAHEIAERGLPGCPGCGGPTEYDRCLPPNPYYCDECREIHDYNYDKWNIDPEAEDIVDKLCAERLCGAKTVQIGDNVEIGEDVEVKEEDWSEEWERVGPITWNHKTKQFEPVKEEKTTTTALKEDLEDEDWKPAEGDIPMCYSSYCTPFSTEELYELWRKWRDR